MKHQEVKLLQQELSVLLTHVVEKKIDIFHLNYGLNKNLDRLTAAVKEIDANISQELKDLEMKIQKIGTDKKDELSKLDLTKQKKSGLTEEYVKSILSKESFEVGILFGAKEDNDRHAELMTIYMNDMQEENSVELFKLDAEKLDKSGLHLEFSYMTILSKFL